MVGNGAAEETPKELSDRGDRVEGAQPGGRDHEAIFKVFAKVSAERRDGEHRAVDLGIESPTEAQCQHKLDENTQSLKREESYQPIALTLKKNAHQIKTGWLRMTWKTVCSCS